MSPLYAANTHPNFLATSLPPPCSRCSHIALTMQHAGSLKTPVRLLVTSCLTVPCSAAMTLQVADELVRKMDIPKRQVALRIEWRDLSFHIGSSAVLQKLDGHVSHGELVALMGESGSGKSTLLNILGGRAAYGQMSGALSLNGRVYTPHRLKHMVGFVLQSYILYDELTVFENLDLAARVRGPTGEAKAHRQRRVNGILGLLGLSAVRDFVLDKHLGVGRLSGGQMRRVGIGVELAADASILLLVAPHGGAQTLEKLTPPTSPHLLIRS